jgi:leucine dehydrogenase
LYLIITKIMDIASEFAEFDGHEAVVSLFDETTGLRGFIGIHSTMRGPATGGTRYAVYETEADALRDALRLSRAMTYKCALAGVSYGGGKAVIIRTKEQKSKALLRAYAERINLLGGRFYTGQDVGITKADVAVMQSVSPFIGTKAGDLGRWAALGVFHAMKASVKEVFGTASLQGRTVAVKGLGKLGFPLCEFIVKEGGKLIITDIDPATQKKAKNIFSDAAMLSRPNEIHGERVDIYSPCALGGEFNEKTIGQLRCAIVCGGANNQLGSARDGVRLHEKGIVYVPDYLANAGGLISVMDERNRGGYNPLRVDRAVKRIGVTAQKVIRRARREKKSTSELADHMAESIFRSRRSSIVRG